MINEKVIVIDARKEVKSPIEFVLSMVEPQNPLKRMSRHRLFKRQLRLFYYVDGDRSGVVYTRHERDNPLTSVDGNTFMEGLRSAATSTGAIVSGCQLYGVLHTTPASVDQPIELSNYQHIELLKLVLSSQHEQLGVRRPRETKRFLVNFGGPVFDEVVLPYIKSRGYREIRTIRA